MIAVVNARDWKQDGEYIGWANQPRFPVSSPLANPFLGLLKRGISREDVVARYRGWLRNQYRVNGPAKRELLRLSHKHKAGENIVLVCWCKPDPCHGDVVAEAIAGIEKTLKVSTTTTEEPKYPSYTLSNESAMVRVVGATYDPGTQTLVAAQIVTNAKELQVAVRASLSVNRKNSFLYLNGPAMHVELLGARRGYQVITANLEAKTGAQGLTSFLLHPGAGNPAGLENFYVVSMEHEDPVRKFIQRLALATPWGYLDEWGSALYEHGLHEGLIESLPVVGVSDIRNAIRVSSSTDAWRDIIRLALYSGEITLAG
ncbi:MAG: hypothetical protein XU15_C0011G0084 [candidate division NC10 bacterium CSP1-5]|nr:MAG: hypothetical protein XU15_C0011G0084 [candidate division NC10 bacterium CSP1-5]